MRAVHMPASRPLLPRSNAKRSFLLLLPCAVALGLLFCGPGHAGVRGAGQLLGASSGLRKTASYDVYAGNLAKFRGGCAAEGGAEGGGQNLMDMYDEPTLACVTKPAPAFEGEAVMPDGSFETLKLDKYKGKWLVLLFYPLDFTFVCPTELTTISDKIGDFEKLGASVLGVSIDSKYTHLQWTKTPRTEGGLGKLKFPLMSDIHKNIGKEYGCMHPTDGHHLRGTYIIDPKGVVRHITLNDPPVGRNADEILRLIQGYQFADKHGEVCPMGWKPGQSTIKDDPELKKEYFHKKFGSGAPATGEKDAAGEKEAAAEKMQE